MKKLIAILAVVSWSGFWAFGYIALGADGVSERQLVIAAVLAFAGFLTGVLAYLKLCRASEEAGLERRRQMDPARRERAQAQGRS
ncbi:hypothetical protein [Pseudodonghicola xiamenensis]|uniref:Uncharacterized protein n=1 Tax=Pseudodonghicola xiamenensis TaxID=337702 RepID=A0A8J3MC08_9RHOB|nr:hypothetical protein [Pseudodonghicola xiamenensis]GHG81958.1 hypothetical protein GCM10010961_06090 [Pseudodonghicola xiamenensis]